MTRPRNMADRVSSLPLDRVVLALATSAYITVVLILSTHPTPRTWGVDLLGYLPSVPGLLIRCAMVAGTALLFMACRRGPAAAESSRSGRRRRSRWISGRWAAPIFVMLCASLFWILRTRTHFLGDGALWLSRTQSGEALEGNEPLAEAFFTGAAGLLRALHLPIVPETLAILSIASGCVTAALAWATAREFQRLGRPFTVTLLLITTLGASQLYFGYIESYPPVMALEVGFLYLGLRTIRTGSAPLTLSIVLALAIASHVACLVLAVGYFWIVWRNVRRPSLRVAFLLGPLLGAAILMFLVGYGPDRFAETVRIAALAIAPTAGALPSLRDARPYGVLSLAHAVDMVNELLLVAPIPILLALAAPWHRREQARDHAEDSSRFLTITALSGMAAFSVLVLPVAAAQDWDLYSLLVVPAALAAIFVAGPILQGPDGTRVRVGVSMLGAATLGSFVLVNANPIAGVHRFETLLGPRAQVTRFARTYGDELLASYYRNIGDPDAALAHATALIRNEPTNPRLWSMVGAVLCDQRRYSDAIPYLEQAISRGRISAGTHTNLGICYSQVGRPDDALNQFRAAARLEPNRADHQVNLALGLLGVGKADSAKILLLRTLRVWPRYDPARNALERHFPSTR